MNIIVKRFIVISAIVFISRNLLLAQEVKSINFLGINPSVTVEPFYEKGELDVNIFPLVYQTPLTKIFDLRLNSILNLGVRNGGNEISHYGIETGIPIFFNSKGTKYEVSNGIFIAPILGLTRNRIEEHNNIGIWIEPGYNLLIDNKYAMTFGLQFGKTYFDYDNGKTNWGNHFGVKIILGKWL